MLGTVTYMTDNYMLTEKGGDRYWYRYFTSLPAPHGQEEAKDLKKDAESFVREGWKVTVVSG